MPLIEQDFTMLKALCELALAKDSVWLTHAEALTSAREARLAEAQAEESLNVLRHRRLVETQDNINGVVLQIAITATGFDTFALKYLDGYASLLAKAAQWLHRHRDGWPTNVELASELGVQQVLANHLLVVLSSRGWLRLGGQELGGLMPAYDLSAELGRLGTEGGTSTTQEGDPR